MSVNKCFCWYKTSQKILTLFNVLAQFCFITGEMELRYYHMKLYMRVASRAAKRLKTKCRYSLVPRFPSKTKALVNALEYGTKSAIKLSIKILLHLISSNHRISKA